MTPAGYSGTPLARKLGIKAGHRVAALGPPAHLPDLLAPLPDAVVLEADPPLPGGPDAAGARSRDVVVAFVPDRAALVDRLDAGHRLLAWDGGLWIAWPKKSSPLASDIGREDVRDAGLELGLVDNKVCAIDADWSGLRFVHRVENRPG